MKAYSIDLRKRIVEQVKKGSSVENAARRYKVSTRSAYRYVEAERRGELEPKSSWGGSRKVEPEKLREAVARRPDATLAELAQEAKVHFTTVWHALRRMGITRKKKRRSTRSGASFSAPSTGWSSGTG